MPDVDVLIPCFNAARYVGAAIESVLGQDWQPARIIVVDDGSTDASAGIIRSYAPRVEYFHQPNGGISCARNAAAARSSADYLAFLDADDLWTGHSLSVRMAYLGANAHQEGVFGALVQFISPELEESLAGRYRVDPEPAVARFAGTFILARAAFERVGPFNVGLRTGEMIEWMARAEANCVALGTVPDLVLRRRIHDSNTVLRSGGGQADYLKAIRQALASRRAVGKASP